MSGDWRHTPAGTAAYVGIVVVAAGVAVATEADFSAIVRSLALVPVVVVVVVAVIWATRVLRSRGRRRGGRNRRPGV